MTTSTTVPPPSSPPSSSPPSAAGGAQRGAAGLPVQRPACLDADPLIFFSEDMAVLEQAKRVCRTCGLRTQCLDTALRRAEPHGVWGGELFDHGRVVERKRPRGRPRKHPVPAEQTGYVAWAS